ncbi:hypothetical protein E2C01_028735 [Portunus trituberculatus]|uniref:Uncharacterized protein n=1 Tax=Portunus trituberculatus TaxID=210409 RepID=A0A5B7ESK8_PORTR|nr:hypothetical protein [Portunus trituberculatus]
MTRQDRVERRLHSPAVGLVKAPRPPLGHAVRVHPQEHQQTLRSLTLFCTGVPVTHHLLTAARRSAISAVLVVVHSTICASSRHTRHHSTHGSGDGVAMNRLGCRNLQQRGVYTPAASLTVAVGEVDVVQFSAQRLVSGDDNIELGEAVWLCVPVSRHTAVHQHPHRLVLHVLHYLIHPLWRGGWGRLADGVWSDNESGTGCDGRLSGPAVRTHVSASVWITHIVLHTLRMLPQTTHSTLHPEPPCIHIRCSTYALKIRLWLNFRLKKVLYRSAFDDLCGAVTGEVVLVLELYSLLQGHHIARILLPHP